MKDFNIKKYLLDNPLTKDSNKGKLDESFDGVGGVLSLKPVNEAPIKPTNIYADEPVDMKNQWIKDINRMPLHYGDWIATWEHPGIISWVHPDIAGVDVIATPGWDGPGTPVEFQSEAGSSQMLKILDQDDFETAKDYIDAVAPYLDMVADANGVGQEDEGYMGTDYKSSEDMAVDMLKKGITREDSFIDAQRDANSLGKMKTLFVMDYNSGKVFSKMIPGNMQSEDIEELLDGYNFNLNDIYYMVSNHSEVEDMDNL
jgi:hypothetical protein